MTATQRRGSVLSREIAEHRRGLGEAHLVAAGDRVVGEVLRDHRLTHAVRTKQNQVLWRAVLEEAEIEELLDLPPWDLLGVLPIEVRHRSHGADLRASQAAFEAPSAALGLLDLDELRDPRGVAKLAPAGAEAMEAERAGPLVERITISPGASGGAETSSPRRVISELSTCACTGPRLSPCGYPFLRRGGSLRWSRRCLGTRRALPARCLWRDRLPQRTAEFASDHTWGTSRIGTLPPSLITGATLMRRRSSLFQPSRLSST